jgi:hypothetical protein
MYKTDIGINAGAIWRLLSEKGELSVREIGEITHYRETFLLLALGWLAREDKIRFFEEGGWMYVELINSFPEAYF